jgi:hypothetical protein
MMIGTRFFSALIAVVAAASVLVPTGSTSAQASGQPTLYFVYAMNCTFTIENDAGAAVTSIAPGGYEVDVRTPVPFGTVPLQVEGITDMTACRGFPQFQLTGPGVNISTTMTAGCSSDLTFPETFQPGATYVAQDNNQAAVTRTVLTILASGTPTAPPATAVLPTKATASGDIVGSGRATLQGALAGTLSATGVPTLMSKGKPVTSLKAGSYKFTIVDKDPKGSFTIQAPKLGSTANLSGVAFVGKETKTFTLKAGKWMYYTGLGKMYPFVVTG